MTVELGYLELTVMTAVGNWLLIRICALPFFCVLRTAIKARPFHVVTCDDVEGSQSLRSAEAAAIRIASPLTLTSQAMAASGQTCPSLSKTYSVMNASDWPSDLSVGLSAVSRRRAGLPAVSSLQFAILTPPELATASNLPG